MDEACRRYAELQKRLNSGTPEQAVDFFNDHGPRVRHGFTIPQIYDEYLADLSEHIPGERMKHAMKAPRHLSSCRLVLNYVEFLRCAGTSNCWFICEAEALH